VFENALADLCRPSSHYLPSILSSAETEPRASLDVDCYFGAPDQDILERLSSVPSLMWTGNHVSRRKYIDGALRFVRDGVVTIVAIQVTLSNPCDDKNTMEFFVPTMKSEGPSVTDFSLEDEYAILWPNN
jgi:hypothetical protein